MRSFLYLLLIFTITHVSSDTSSSLFCLCALKPILEEYALVTSNHLPPRYRSSFKNDIGFFVAPSSQWMPVNDASWTELAAVINAPSGMYTRISLDGIHPINNGLTLDGLRSGHLSDIMTTYRLITDYVNIFHENIIKSRSEMCNIEQRKQTIGSKSSRNNWEQFFVSG